MSRVGNKPRLVGTYEEALADLPKHLRQAVIDHVDISSRAAASDFRRFAEAIEMLRKAARWMDDNTTDDCCPTCGGASAHDVGCLRDAIQKMAWPSSEGQAVARCWGYLNGDGLCRGHGRPMAECHAVFQRCPSCGRPQAEPHANGCVKQGEGKRTFVRFAGDDACARCGRLEEVHRDGTGECFPPEPEGATNR